MLLHVSKRRHMSIWSSSVRINFQLLPLILVVATVEFYLATTSSSTVKYSPSASVSSSSRIIFSLSSLVDSDPYLVKLYYLSFLFSSFLSCILRLFCHVDFVFLVLPVLTFSSCQFCEFLCLVFYLCWTTNYTVLVGSFKLPTTF